MTTVPTMDMRDRNPTYFMSCAMDKTCIEQLRIAGPHGGAAAGSGDIPRPLERAGSWRVVGQPSWPTTLSLLRRCLISRHNLGGRML